MVELALAPGENRLEESMSRCLCGCESDIGVHPQRSPVPLVQLPLFAYNMVNWQRRHR